MRAREAEVRQLFDTIVDGIIALDPNGRILDVNVAIERALGYSPAELVGRPVYELLRPMLKTAWGASRNSPNSKSSSAAVLECQDRTLEFTGLRKDGSTFIAEGTLQPFPSLGAEVSAIFVRDVTQRRQAELELDRTRRDLERRSLERSIELKLTYERLQREMVEREQVEQQAQQLRDELAHVSRLSTLGELASGLAHELNQPLTAIVAHVESSLAALQAAGFQDDEIYDDLRISVVQARRAAEIIKRLRSLVGKHRPHRELVDVCRLVNEIVDLLAIDAKTLGIDVAVEHTVRLPPVIVDRIQIQQVLLNLIRNALEAMSAPQSESRVVHIVTRGDIEGAPIVQVIDHGPVVSAEHLAKMFRPFFTTKPKGLGLGLSISRSIVEDHGGKLTAQINPEGGLTMTFHLPQGTLETPPPRH